MKLLALFCFILCLLLAIRYVFYFQHLKVYKAGDSFQGKTTLLSEPKHSEFSQSFRVDSLSIQTPAYPKFHYGDSVYIEGKVEENKFESENGKTIIQFVVKNPKIKLQETNILIKSATFLRNRIMTTFQQHLPHKEASLLFGIVFGGTQGFSKDTQDLFRNSGVLHVVAASGMNVTMVAEFLILVLSYFLNRRVALVLAIIGVFYYALLSGFSPSIVRASLMAGIAFSALAWGRQSYAYLGLCIAVFVMLMFHPGTIVDVGFLLSLTSTLGILFVKPLFDSFMLFQRTKVVSDDIGTTLSAQTGSLPIMAGVFGSYSYISVVVNAFVLWTIPFLMILGGIAALCAIAIPIISVPFLWLCLPLLLYFEAVIAFFGNFPMLDFSYTSWSLVIGYYLILISLVLFMKRRIKAKTNDSL